MQNKTNIELISTEVAGFWNTYMNDTLAVCVLKHFLNTLNDEETRHIIQHALDISNGHIQLVRDILNKNGIPIPNGFGEDDVNMKAPKLYTDPFYLFYLEGMGQIGMNNYALMLNHVARPDVRDFFSKCVHESIGLFNLVADALQQQGLYIKAPRIEFNKDVDFIDKQNFFSAGWFGKKRRITAREITSVFAGMLINTIGKGLITGFGQVSQSKKVSDYFFRGRDLAQKKINSLIVFFTDENIPIPSTSDSFVTDSTTAPFSEKLMMFHTVLLHVASTANDGNALANVMRHDMQAFYIGSIMETMKYAEDGVDILIENRWMEQPPQAIEHKELVKV